MPEQNISIKTIKDPVHGLIKLYPIEQRIVDRPLFQRLRCVSQQGLTHLTFPSDQHTRAPHSFGTAHVAGLMFKRAIENARKPVLEQFICDAYDLIETVSNECSKDLNSVLKESDELIGDALGFDHRPLRNGSRIDCRWKHESKDGLDYNLACKILNILWQSVRVATLVHDIGHLPFSHTFENAIHALHDASAPISDNESGSDGSISEAYERLTADFRKKYKKLIGTLNLDTLGLEMPHAKRQVPPHEQLGMLLCDEFRFEHRNNIWSIVTTIGRLLFIIEPIPYEKLSDTASPIRVGRWGVIQALHTIVSGELDADRIDYSTRDPASAAVASDAVDISELVDNLQLVRVEQGDHSTFAISLRSKAVPYVESFFVQRYMNYRTILNHHNVLRVDTLLRQAIQSVLLLAGQGDSHFDSIFYDACLTRIGKNGKRTFPIFDDRAMFERFDDTWFRELLSRVVQKIRILSCKKVEDPSFRIDNYDDILMMQLLCEASLYRQTEFMLSATKNDGNLLVLRNSVRDLLVKDKEWDDALERTLDSILNCEGIEDADGQKKFRTWTKSLREDAESLVRDEVESDEKIDHIVIPLVSKGHMRLTDTRRGGSMVSGAVWVRPSIDEEQCRMLHLRSRLPYNTEGPFAGCLSVACSPDSDGTELRDLLDVSLLLRVMNLVTASNAPKLHVAFLGRKVKESSVADKLQDLFVQKLADLCLTLRIDQSPSETAQGA